MRLPTILFILITSSCAVQQQAGEAFYVTKVVDGDTFWGERNDGTRVKVRMIGIDAPETRRSEFKEIGYYGEEAKAFLTERIDNQEVYLRFDVDSLDQYGRTLAYVYLEDETFVNAEMIENGYAKMVTFPPNVEHVKLFERLQREAREKSVGLWERE